MINFSHMFKKADAVTGGAPPAAASSLVPSLASSATTSPVTPVKPAPLPAGPDSMFPAFKPTLPAPFQAEPAAPGVGVNASAAPGINPVGGTQVRNPANTNVSFQTPQISGGDLRGMDVGSKGRENAINFIRASGGQAFTDRNGVTAEHPAGNVDFMSPTPGNPGGTNMTASIDYERGNPNKRILKSQYGSGSVDNGRPDGWKTDPNRKTVIDGKTYYGPDPMRQHLTPIVEKQQIAAQNAAVEQFDKAHPGALNKPGPVASKDPSGWTGPTQDPRYNTAPGALPGQNAYQSLTDPNGLPGYQIPADQQKRIADMTTLNLPPSPAKPSAAPAKPSAAPAKPGAAPAKPGAAPAKPALPGIPPPGPKRDAILKASASDSFGDAPPGLAPAPPSNAVQRTLASKGAPLDAKPDATGLAPPTAPRMDPFLPPPGPERDAILKASASDSFGDAPPGLAPAPPSPPPIKAASVRAWLNKTASLGEAMGASAAPTLGAPAYTKEQLTAPAAQPAAAPTSQLPPGAGGIAKLGPPVNAQGQDLYESLRPAPAALTATPAATSAPTAAASPAQAPQPAPAPKSTTLAAPFGIQYGGSGLATPVQYGLVDKASLALDGIGEQVGAGWQHAGNWINSNIFGEPHTPVEDWRPAFQKRWSAQAQQRNETLLKNKDADGVTGSVPTFDIKSGSTLNPIALNFAIKCAAFASAVMHTPSGLANNAGTMTPQFQIPASGNANPRVVFKNGPAKPKAITPLTAAA